MEDRTNPFENKSDGPKEKKWIWAVSIVLLVLIIGAGVYWKLIISKDGDDSGVSTTKTEVSDQDSVKKDYDPSEYSWSTMKQGPYHDKISYATGTSLTNWTDSGQILAEHVSVPEVILKDDVIYAYFADTSVDGIPEQIGMIKSSDQGKTWSDKEIINIEGLGNKVAVDPDPFVLDDGKIRLYYFDISTTKSDPKLEKNTIYSAISTDGINFVEEDGIRFNYPAIFDPEVIKVGNDWTMYVGTDDQKVLYATSSDGLTFNYGGVALSEGAIPNVILDNNTYYLFTGGIEISTSKDGKTFTKTGKKFDCGGLTADPGILKLGENKYFMIYKTR